MIEFSIKNCCLMCIKITLKALNSFKCLILCFKISFNLEFDLEKSGKFQEKVRKISWKSQEIFLSLICGNPARSGSGRISVKIRPEPDPDLFFKSRSGRNRIRIFFSYQYPAGSGYQTKMAISGRIRTRIVSPVHL